MAEKLEIYDSADKVVHYVSLVSSYRVTEADEYQRKLTPGERKQAAKLLDILGMRPLREGDR